MTLTFFGWLSHAIQLRSKIHVSVRTPKVLLPSVWPLPFSLATTHGISVDFSSSWYLDVSVPKVPRVNLWIQLTLHDSSSWGFPHSEICGSMLIYSSPQLIAVSHVLHRLPVPRHSPYALVRLNSLCLFSSLLELRLQLIVIGFFSNFAVEKAFYLFFATIVTKL